MNDKLSMAEMRLLYRLDRLGAPASRTDIARVFQGHRGAERLRMLRRLERLEILESYPAISRLGPPRRMYRITDAGQKTIAELKARRQIPEDSTV